MKTCCTCETYPPKEKTVKEEHEVFYVVFAFLEVAHQYHQNQKERREDDQRQQKSASDAHGCVEQAIGIRRDITCS